MVSKKHIDDVQPKTVDEHFRLLIEDTNVIDSKPYDVTIDDLPPWYDEDLFQEGQAYYMRNLMGMGVASLLGLIAIVVVPETLEVLLFTKQSTRICPAFRRYAQTLLHIYKLYKSDSMDPESKFYKSLNVIRHKHSVTSRRSLLAGINGIYQKDMAITQYGFIGYALLTPKVLGLSNKPEERQGLTHFWRVVGHLLGIDDRINICRKSEKETTELCQRISDHIIAKHLKAENPKYIELVNTMLDSIWYIDIALDREAAISLTYDCVGLKYPKSLSWYSQLNKQYRGLMMYLFTIPYLGPIVRVYFNYMLMLTYWVLEHYPIYAILGFGREESRLKLYPRLW